MPAHFFKSEPLTLYLSHQHTAAITHRAQNFGAPERRLHGEPPREWKKRRKAKSYHYCYTSHCGIFVSLSLSLLIFPHSMVALPAPWYITVRGASLLSLLPMPHDLGYLDCQIYVDFLRLYMVILCGGYACVWIEHLSPVLLSGKALARWPRVLC